MIHIFTLNWNGKDKMNELYHSFNELNKNFDYLWHIKDNNSTDGSIELIESWNDKNINLIKYPHNNDNFSQGMNYLFNISKPKDGDLILLLNNDIVFKQKDDLIKMMSYFKNKDVGIVGCKLLFKDTDLIQHGGVVFNEQLRMPIHFGLRQKDSKDFSYDREFQVVTGAVLMIRKECYENIHTNKSGNKGMDESFIWAFDDVDACLSVKYKQNKKVIYCGSTKIFHEESASLKKNPVNKMFMNHNVYNLLNKWGKTYHTDKIKYMTNSKYNLYLNK